MSRLSHGFGTAHLCRKAKVPMKATGALVDMDPAAAYSSNFLLTSGSSLFRSID
jgi:hypothetical protein